MFYKYKCGNEIIRVFVWDDDFHNNVLVEDTKTPKSYDRTIDVIATNETIFTGYNQSTTVTNTPLSNNLNHSKC